MIRGFESPHLHHKSRTGFRSVFIMSAGDGLRPERPCAFPNPRADAIGPRQQSLFRRKAPYESPHLHHKQTKSNPVLFAFSFISIRQSVVCGLPFLFYLAWFRLSLRYKSEQISSVRFRPPTLRQRKPRQNTLLRNTVGITGKGFCKARRKRVL